MRNARVSLSISGGTSKPDWLEQYDVIGKIGEGSFGVVYLAVMKSDSSKRIAIKKFRPTSEGGGVSPTAIREMKLLRETEHENVVKLLNVHINHAEKSVYLAFDYAEYELLEIIAYHRNMGNRPINPYTIKSIMWQLLDGVNYLHSNWIIHRDLKPGNILVMGPGKDFGVVKIADFGLARTFDAPLRPISQDGVVETIWYRAPELLLGSNHYTSAIDMWAVGCVFAEFFTLKPIFRGREVPPVFGMPAPFQFDQLDKIFRILGHPTQEKWPLLVDLPYWQANLQRVQERKYNNAEFNNVVALSPHNPAYDLLSKMLEYDPSKRITAVQALQHEYFRTEPQPGRNTLVPPQPGMEVVVYPSRLVDTRSTVI